jgi:hypothetical protein
MNTKLNLKQFKMNTNVTNKQIVHKFEQYMNQLHTYLQLQTSNTQYNASLQYKQYVKIAKS